MREADHDISVDVQTNFMSEQSDPLQDRYVFAYTITIRNKGDIPATLMTRHWIITDGNGRESEVRGDGVVGEQPYLSPGEGFRYTSSAILTTPVGSMRGSYQLLDGQGEHFDAPIAPFILAMPGSLH
jgi:ApaG protein